MAVSTIDKIFDTKNQDGNGASQYNYKKKKTKWKKNFKNTDVLLKQALV